MHATPPPECTEALLAIAKSSRAVSELANPAVIADALSALSTRLDGKPASPPNHPRFTAPCDTQWSSNCCPPTLLTTSRGRSPGWPKPSIGEWSSTPNKRQTCSPQSQRRCPHLWASSPATTTRRSARPRSAICVSRTATCPSQGGAPFVLVGSTTTSTATWTDDKRAHTDRQLKHRANNDTRVVPVPPELVETLRRHISRFGPGAGGRLFVARTKRSGAPLPAPYGTPISMGIVTKSGTRLGTQPSAPNRWRRLWRSGPTTCDTPRSRCCSTPVFPDPSRGVGRAQRQRALAGLSQGDRRPKRRSSTPNPGRTPATHWGRPERRHFVAYSGRTAVDGQFRPVTTGQTCDRP